MAGSESNIIQRFRERVDRGSIPVDMKVTYRVAGGMPSERLEEEFTLSGGGRAEVRARDEFNSRPLEYASVDLGQAEIRDAFQKVRNSLDVMVPRSQARFLPDSLVGSVDIEMGGERITLYFPVEDEEMQGTTVRHGAERAMAAPSPLADTIQYFKLESRRLLSKGEGGSR